MSDTYRKMLKDLSHAIEKILNLENDSYIAGTSDCTNEEILELMELQDELERKAKQ